MVSYIMPLCDVYTKLPFLVNGRGKLAEIINGCAIMKVTEHVRTIQSRNAECSFD